MLKLLGTSVLIGIIVTFVVQKMTKKTNTGSISGLMRANMAKAFPVIAERGPTTGWGPETTNTANGGTYPSYYNFPRYPALWNISPAAPVTGNQMTFVGGLGFERENDGYPISY